MAGSITQGQLSEDIQLGGGGGGALNFDDKGSMESLDPAVDLSNGKSAIFGDAAPAATVLPTLDEVAPLNGDVSLEYLNHATPGSSTLDWGLRLITIPEGYRGRVLEFKIQYQNTYSSSSVNFIVGTGESGISSDNRYEKSLVPYKETTNNTGTELSFRFKPETREDVVYWGYHILQGEAGAFLKFDDATVTPDLREVQETAFIESEDSMVRLHTSNGYGSTNNKIRRFSSLIEKTGSAVTYLDTAADGASFLIEQRGIYHISYSDIFSGAEHFGISKNSTELTTEIFNIADNDRLNSSITETSGRGDAIAWSGQLEKGDIIRAHTGGTGDSANPERAQFTITKTGSVHAFPALKDQKIEIPTSEIKMSGTPVMGTGIELKTVKWPNISELSGSSLAVDNSTGTVITVKKDGVVDVSCSIGTGGTIYITKNSPERISGSQSSEVVFASSAPGVLELARVLSWSGKVIAGDQLRVWNNSLSTFSGSSFNVLHQEQEVSVAVNNIEPQYGEVDSMVRLSVGNGFGSTATKIRRFANVDDNLGSAITYTDSIIDGASFTANEDGVYHVSYSEESNAAFAQAGISLNASSLVSDINNLPSSERLTIETGDGGNARVHSGWSGYLKAGDIIRPQISSTMISGGLGVHFTITKEAKASIIGIDGRPVDAYQQRPDVIVEGVGNSGEVLVGEVTDVTFDMSRDSHGAWNGQKFTVPETGIYSFCGEVHLTGNVADAVGLFRDGIKDTVIAYDSVSKAYHSFNVEKEFKEGEEVSIRMAVGGTLSDADDTHHWISITKTGSLIRSIPLVDSTVDIPISHVRLEGTTGRGTGGESSTYQYQTLAQISGGAISVDSSNGTLFTILKGGIVSMSVTGTSIVADQWIEITLNDQLAGQQESTLARQRTDGTGADRSANCSFTRRLEKGDTLRVLGTSDPSIDDIRNIVELTHQETEVAVTLSNVAPQFEDVDSMIRLNGLADHGSSTLIQRFTNIAEIKGGAITYRDDAALGATFEVNEDGFYSISYTFQKATDSDNGISLNSTELSTNIASLINSSDALAQASEPNASRQNNVSWSGPLKAGDIVRAHGDGANVGPQPERCSFTISKAALPSIAEVNVTPFVDLDSAETSKTIINSVSLEGNDGRTNSLSIESIPFDGNGTGWVAGPDGSTPTSGNYYTVQNSSSVVSLLGSTEWSTTQSLDQFLYLNGVRYKLLSKEVGTTTHKFSYLSGLGEFSVGDKLALLQENSNANLQDNGEKHYINIVETYEETVEGSRSTVYAVEDNENIFSAKIQNNGTASLTSQSINFIDSITRNSVGHIQINYSSGFFSEVPSIVVTQANESNRRSAQVLISTIGHSIIRCFDTSDNSDEDLDFDILVQRQKSDYRDLQRQIVQLTDFPRINNSLTGSIDHNAGTATFLDLNNQVRFDLNNLAHNGDTLVVAEDDPANTRTKFNNTHSSDVVVHIHWGGDDVNNNGVPLRMWKNGATYAQGTAINSSTNNKAMHASMILKPGEYFTVGAKGTMFGSAGAAYLRVIAQAQELGKIGNVEQAENVFSARIANNGTASVVSESSPFIQSVTRSSIGAVDIVYTPGFFGAEPAVSITSEEGNRIAGIDGLTASQNSVRVLSRVHDGSAEDKDFTIQVMRQDSDYKNLAEVVVTLPESKTKYQTKILSANVTTTGAIAELTFTSLELGKTYEIIGQIAMLTTSGGGPTGVIREGGGTILAGYQFDGGGGTEAGCSAIATGSFVATDTLVLLDATGANASSILEGNGTKNDSGTWLQLREFPLHEQTSEW